MRITSAASVTLIDMAAIQKLLKTRLNVHAELDALKRPQAETAAELDFHARATDETRHLTPTLSPFEAERERCS